jgi:hypothetical protein
MKFRGPLGKSRGRSFGFRGHPPNFGRRNLKFGGKYSKFQGLSPKFGRPSRSSF